MGKLILTPNRPMIHIILFISCIFINFKNDENYFQTNKIVYNLIDCKVAEDIKFYKLI